MQRKHVEYFYDGAPEAFPIASAPGTPYGSQRYDAFGRAVQTFDLDGTMTLKTVYHALGTDLWDAADLSTGPHASTYASERKDGHGRILRVTERAHSGNTVQARHVITEYSPAGQPEVLTRRLGSNAAKDVVRWMRYDSLGRMVLNVDPHTSTGDLTVPDPATTLADYERPNNLKAWAYLYNHAGDLVGTEDARGCGVNFSYDPLGRLLGEDYVPCEATHQAYSAPNGDRTEGWEVVYYYDGPPSNGDQVPAELGTHRYNKGRLVAVRDRAAETTTFVDGRGRVISTVRRVGSPADANEVVDNKIANRYTAQWFYKRAAYDAADRVVAESVGGQLNNARTAFDGAPAQVFGDPQDKQVVRTHYTARGTIQGIDGSYGTLVRKLTRRADGLVTNLVYGDSAGTQTSTTYDDRRRPVSIQTYRAGSPLWSAFATGGSGVQNVTYSPVPSLAGTNTTFQMLLEDTDLAYDEVGNPVEIRDWREASEWPASNKPVTKKIEYDDLYRVRRMDYLYSTAAGTDTWTSPFDKENTEADADRDIRRAKPVPQLSFAKRPVWQRFEYDWLGNLSESDDDAHGIYDRSLGTQEHKNAGKPYQLTRGSNATQAASGGFSGNVTAVYDAAGNMTRLSVVRPNTTGVCIPTGVGCTQYYAYNWDEVGRLVRAQRWDSTSQSQLATDPVPTATASYELRYRYDASDQRVIKRLYRSSMASQRQSLYLFGSLEVHRTAYSGTTYTIDDKTLVPYAMSNGVRLARLHYETATTVPQVAGTGLTDALGKTNTAATLHVLLELGDHLGSTGTVLDKVSSELVERTGYLPFGARENDYRPSRWNGFREDYGFTGKEEDVQVGLVYFGKRYLSPQLGRWLSPDPLAVHAPGRADFNLYAYVSGAVLKNVDPVGLDDEMALQERRPVIEVACKLLSDRAVLEEARDRQMERGGLAEKMLDHFLDNTGTPVHVDLNKMLKSDAGMKLRISREITAQVERQLDAGKSGGEISGMVFVRQKDYSVEDNRLALGGTYVWFHVNATADARAKNQNEGGLNVKLNLVDRYLWSPNDASRPTQCLHQAAQRLEDEGSAKEFVQYGEGETRIKIDEAKVFNYSSGSEEISRVPDTMQDPASYAPVQEDHP